MTIQAPQLDINTVAAGGGSRLFFRRGLFQARVTRKCTEQGSFAPLADAIQMRPAHSAADQTGVQQAFVGLQLQRVTSPVHHPCTRQAGPESAGAHPGPVCYRKGGHLAITDANLVLGRILPDFFPKIFGPTEDQSLDDAAARFHSIEQTNPDRIKPI